MSCKKHFDETLPSQEPEVHDATPNLNRPLLLGVGKFIGIPHKSLDDDVYNGTLIPKRSTIIANTRETTLDENIYKDPFEFDPQRFVPTPEGRGEPFASGPSGFGRRVCPGLPVGIR